MPFNGQPNFNQFNSMMMGNQLPNQNLAANLFAGQNLFNPNDFLNPLEINAAQMERSSQQTQTDETRIKENGGTPQSPQVINQFQNINVQLHLPPQQLPGSQVSNQQNPLIPGIMDFQQQLFQAQLFNQMLLQNQGHDPQMQVGGTSLQNMMAMNPLFFNPMISQQTPNFPGSSPFFNPQAQFLAHQQLLQQQQQFQQHSLNQQQSMFQQQQFIPQPQSSLVNTSSTQPVKPYHRSPSYPANTNHQQSSPQPYNNGNGNYQQTPGNNAHNLIQEILNHLQLQNNGIAPNLMKQDDNNDPSSQQHMISHITQEKQDEIYKVQAKEEQLFFKLDQEIYKIQGKLKLKLAAIESERQMVIRKIEYIVKNTFKEHPEARIQMYGSMATGLAIDSSDMDLLISGVFCFDAQKIIGYQVPLYIERHLMIEQLLKLFKDLQKIKEGEDTQDSSQTYINACSIIETASVPVIKLVIDLQQIRDNEAKKLGISSTDQIESDMRYLKIDITFNDSIDQQQQMLLNFFNIAQTQHMGIQCCNFIVERLQMYPILESLTLVLKKFLAIRNLNSPFLGGLNSYGLIILIIAYLNESYQDYFGQDSQLSKSRALKGFFYFYGKQFDQSQFMINADQQITPHQIFSSTLVIEDPLNPANNIGKSTFNFDKIRTAFSNAHDQIDEMLREFIDQAEDEMGEGNTETGVERKKKLDILSKILAMPSSTLASEEEQSYIQTQKQ